MKFTFFYLHFKEKKPQRAKPRSVGPQIPPFLPFFAPLLFSSPIAGLVSLLLTADKQRYLLTSFIGVVVVSNLLCVYIYIVYLLREIQKVSDFGEVKGEKGDEKGKWVGGRFGVFLPLL